MVNTYRLRGIRRVAAVEALLICALHYTIPKMHTWYYAPKIYTIPQK